MVKSGHLNCDVELFNSMIQEHRRWIENPRDGEPARFAYMNFARWDFRNMDLRAVSFDKCFLTGAIFFNCYLSDTSFQGCHLQGANFCGATLINTQFQYAYLMGVTYQCKYKKSHVKKKTIIKNVTWPHFTLPNNPYPQDNI